MPISWWGRAAPARRAITRPRAWVFVDVSSPPTRSPSTHYDSSSMHALWGNVSLKVGWGGSALRKRKRATPLRQGKERHAPQLLYYTILSAYTTSSFHCGVRRMQEQSFFVMLPFCPILGCRGPSLLRIVITFRTILMSGSTAVVSDIAGTDSLCDRRDPGGCILGPKGLSLAVKQ